jgi:hypothetical protein
LQIPAEWGDEFGPEHEVQPVRYDEGTFGDQGTQLVSKRAASALLAPLLAVPFSAAALPLLTAIRLRELASPERLFASEQPPLLGGDKVGQRFKALRAIIEK